MVGLFGRVGSVKLRAKERERVTAGVVTGMMVLCSMRGCWVSHEKRFQEFSEI